MFFLELFFKAKKNNNFKKPIIIITSKKLLLSQMKKLSFNFKINLIDKNNINFKKLNNKKINIIDINFNFKNSFSKISDKSNIYLNECFKISLKLLKSNNFSGLVNGPISKKKFFKRKIFGYYRITLVLNQIKKIKLQC